MQTLKPRTASPPKNRKPEARKFRKWVTVSLLPLDMDSQKRAEAVDLLLREAWGDVKRAELIGPARELPPEITAPFALKEIPKVRSMPKRPWLQKLTFSDGSSLVYDLLQFKRLANASELTVNSDCWNFAREIPYYLDKMWERLRSQNTNYRRSIEEQVLKGDRRFYGEFFGLVWWSSTGYMNSPEESAKAAKTAAIRDLVNIATESGWKWGVGKDEDVLYIDTPLGQVSFHRSGYWFKSDGSIHSPDGWPTAQPYDDVWDGVVGQTGIVLHRLFNPSLGTDFTMDADLAAVRDFEEREKNAFALAKATTTAVGRFGLVGF